MFTREESRVSLIGASAALVGSLFGAGAALLGTKMTLHENREVQKEANRRQAYTQLKGEEAEFNVLFQELLEAADKNTFYQIRAVQAAAAAKNRPAVQKNQEGVPNYRESYDSEAIQQERNSERYNDDLAVCVQKMFESIGLAELSFPSDQELDRRIVNVQAMLTQSHDIAPKETLKDRVAWVLATKDAEETLSMRHKQQITYVVKAIRPITDLVDYLRLLISKDPGGSP